MQTPEQLRLKHGRRLMTGARPSSRHKLASALPFQPFKVIKARPIVVPSYLEMWLNDQDGDCVTAEEAASLAMYSVMLGLPEVKITDATVLAFCNAYGFLNGANLTDVMDKMISDGFQQDSGYKDGKYAAVDYSNEQTLQAALEIGPVKIGIDSSALPSGAGNGNGWYASGGSPGQFTNEDHCVALWNYGTAAALFGALNTPVPSGFPATGYHLYTWSSVGVVDHAWIMSTVGEAWLRNPTSTSLAPPPPSPPTPTPTPTPTPPVPPTPGPCTLQQMLDSILCALACDAAAIPFVGAKLQADILMVKGMVDGWFSANPHKAQAMCKVGSIQPEVDAVFAAVEALLASRPILLGITIFVQSLVDAYIVSHGL